MAEVTLTDQAQAELAEIIITSTREFGINTGRKFRSSFFDFFKHIASFPNSCAERSRLGNGIRLGVVYPYSVFYLYDPADSRVTILRILHGRRKVTRKMLRDT